MASRNTLGDFFFDLLYQNDYFFPDGQTKPILISPIFATHFLGGTDGDSVVWLCNYLTNRDLRWLNYSLMRQDLLFDHKLLLEELWIPINLSNTHWILIYLDLKNSTFFSINPYHPQNPSIYEVQIAREIALKFSQQYGLQEPVLRSPDYCHCLPYNIHRIP